VGGEALSRRGEPSDLLLAREGVYLVRQRLEREGEST